jgi:hypothetical protein
MTELRKTAGRIQKYNAEKAMLWASILMKNEVLEVLAVILAMATAIAPTKKPCATMMVGIWWLDLRREHLLSDYIGRGRSRGQS